MDNKAALKKKKEVVHEIHFGQFSVNFASFASYLCGCAVAVFIPSPNSLQSLFERVWLDWAQSVACFRSGQQHVLTRSVFRFHEFDAESPSEGCPIPSFIALLRTWHPTLAVAVIK